MQDLLHFDPTTHGLLAKMYCNVDLRLQVLESAAGYYIGTFDPQEGPCSRESQQYYRSYADAEQALTTVSWTQRTRP